MAEPTVHWQGAGEEQGVEIWHVYKDGSSFHVDRWPKEKHGQFYDDDAFIVLSTYWWGDEKCHALYFWIGKDADQEEYEHTSHKCVELESNHLGGKAVQVSPC